MSAPKTSFPSDSAPITAAVKHAAVSESGDAAASTSTNAVVAVGDTFSGRISSGTDTDWIRVELVAGQRYVFTAWGTGGDTAGVNDTTLGVVNSSGSLIVFNDDIGTGNRFSAVSFVAPTSGTYYIQVGSYGSETGTYSVQVATDVYTPEQVASQLVDLNWGFAAPLRLDIPASGVITYNIQGLTTAGQLLAQQALEIWSATTGLIFVATTSSSAMIMFDDNQSGAFAGPSSVDTETGLASSAIVNIGTGWLASYGTTIDSYSFLTYLHEIGHALGLGHAGNYDGFATYGVNNLYRNDSYLVTIMSYFDLDQNTFVNGTAGLPVTPMIADLIAVDRLYDLPAVFTGNTTWGAGSNVPGLLGDIMGVVFDGDRDTRIGTGDLMATIRDNGGTDTLNLSTVTVGQRVDMAPGGVSDVGGNVSNLVIAADTIIENLIGGSAADTVTGNSADNRIEGRNGNDVLRGEGGTDRVYGDVGNDTLFGGSNTDYLYGGAGNDRLEGGDGNDWLVPDAGNDTIYGGAGSDTVSFGNATRGLTINLITGGVTDGRGTTNQLYGVENISGSRLADTIIGDAEDNRLRGNNGRDFFLASAGADTYDGGGSTDTLSYEAASSGVAVNLTTGRGTAGLANGHTYIDIERVFGSNFVDTLTGSEGRDFLSGRDADDFIFATDGADNYYGGAGDDVVDYGSATGGVQISLNLKVGSGNIADGHTLVSIEDVFGSNFGDRLAGTRSDNVLNGRGGDDTLLGYEGNDVLIGGLGNDGLQGAEGNDTMTGGGGNDRLFGGAGTDTAVFSGAQSEYTITQISSSEVRVVHIGGTRADGTDAVYGVEVLQFSDGTVLI